MSINRVSTTSYTYFCSGPDYEQAEIEHRLKMYGIEPTGNKIADKAKLHEIEIQKAKAQNEPSGKFLTVSYSKEQEIIDNKKDKLYGTKKNQKKEQNKDVFKEDEILGRQIMAIIEMKKREEKDYKKSKELRTDKKRQKNYPKKNLNNIEYRSETQRFPLEKTELKEHRIENNET